MNARRGADKKGRKAWKGLREGFYEDHHYELSKIMLGEISPVMTPVKVYPHLRAKIAARIRRNRDNGRGNDNSD